MLAHIVMNNLMTIKDWIVCLIGGIIAMLLQYAVIWSDNFIRSRHGEMHGKWYEVLDEYNGLKERLDVVIIKQRGNRIYGSMKRLLPTEESHRRWCFEGYVRGNHMVVIFHIKNPRADPASYGTVVLRRDMSNRNEVVWRGCYTRPEFTSNEDIDRGSIPMGKMHWQRSRPHAKMNQST